MAQQLAVQQLQQQQQQQQRHHQQFTNLEKSDRLHTNGQSRPHCVLTSIALEEPGTLSTENSHMKYS
eukprot:scaffold206715_cov15-Tisochrysis_lutea.AAC.2